MIKLITPPMVYTKYGVAHAASYIASQYHDSLYHHYDICFEESLSKAVPHRKAEFLAGRFCVKQSLEQLGLKDVSVGIGKHRNPIWPKNVVGSITHCDGFACGVVAKKENLQAIGIDSQSILVDSVAEEICSQVFSTREFDALLRSEDSKNPIITAVFAAKEAFFKCHYPLLGNYFEFKDVEVVAIDLPPSQKIGFMNLELVNHLSDLLPKGWTSEVEFATDGQYYHCLAKLDC